MAEKSSDGRDRPALSLGSDNWPAVVADKIVEVVDVVKVNTTDRAIVAIRFIVYFLVVAAATVSVITLSTVAAVRMADAYLPIGAGTGSATWAAHGFIGLLVTVVGFGAWSCRNGSSKPIYIALVIDAAVVIAVVFYGVLQAVA